MSPSSQNDGLAHEQRLAWERAGSVASGSSSLTLAVRVPRYLSDNLAWAWTRRVPSQASPRAVMDW